MRRCLKVSYIASYRAASPLILFFLLSPAIFLHVSAPCLTCGNLIELTTCRQCLSTHNAPALTRSQPTARPTHRSNRIPRWMRNLILVWRSSGFFSLSFFIGFSTITAKLIGIESCRNWVYFAGSDDLICVGGTLLHRCEVGHFTHEIVHHERPQAICEVKVRMTKQSLLLLLEIFASDDLSKGQTINGLGWSGIKSANTGFLSLAYIYFFCHRIE